MAPSGAAAISPAIASKEGGALSFFVSEQDEFRMVNTRSSTDGNKNRIEHAIVCGTPRLRFEGYDTVHSIDYKKKVSSGDTHALKQSGPVVHLSNGGGKHNNLPLGEIPAQ